MKNYHKDESEGLRSASRKWELPSWESGVSLRNNVHWKKLKTFTWPLIHVEVERRSLWAHSVKAFCMYKRCFWPTRAWKSIKQMNGAHGQRNGPECGATMLRPPPSLRVLIMSYWLVWQMPCGLGTLSSHTGAGALMNHDQPGEAVRYFSPRVS